MSNQKFIGNWKLLSFESVADDGKIFYPYGKDATGYITYVEPNFMTVAIMKAKRPIFLGGDLKGGTVEEKAIAIDEYLSYCGSFSVAGNKIIHHIELSLFPNWIGDNQERFFEFKGDTLKLSTSPFLLGGENRTAHLIWQKVDKI